MTALIVDDEPAIRNIIASLLRDAFPGISVIGTAGTVKEGYELIMQHKPDLLFLDVELPDGNGFDLLKKLKDFSFRVIFVTGHQEYALNAIKVSALDYILKPVDNDELKASIEKACRIIDHDEERIKLQALEENLAGRKVLKRIVLRTSEALQLISIADIIRAEAESNYTHFYMAGNRHVMVSRTLKEYDILLSGSGIIRVHQSHLVNIEYIDRFMKRDGGYLLLKDGASVPVSPNLKKMVLDKIETHLF